jgi:hypothetical protein
MITRNQIVGECKALMDESGSMLDIVVTRAKGAKLWDSNGKEYIDCTSQAFALNVGALNPQVVKAIKREIDRNSHVAASLYSVPLLLLSKKLTEISPGDLNKVNFCLEGSLLDNIIRVPEVYCYRCKFGLEYPSCELKCAQNLEETIESKTDEEVDRVLSIFEEYLDTIS